MPDAPHPIGGNDAEAVDFDAVVVGAGFAGLYMLYRLRALGLSARVFEAGDGVGGTWFWNRYPGARCDVESLQYSYSFSEELQQEWVWTERYPSQAEIQRYINHVADRFALWSDIQLQTRVTAAQFDEAAQRWAVRTDRGDRVSARFVIMATGCLSAARVPDIKGLSSFGGRWFHTGDWPKEGVDFTGLRVGVVGTGSSGIQAIPVIAKQAAHLHVFQRTPNFSIPAWNETLAPERQAAWKQNYAEHRRRARETRSGILYQYGQRGAFEASEEERQREFEARWARGGANFVHAFNDLFIRKESNDTAAEFVRATDPQHRSGPGDGGGAEPVQSSDRHQADLRRYRLLRDVQPGQRDAGGSAQDADRGDHAGGLVDDGGALRARCAGVRDRVRCGDRGVVADRHQRTGRTEAGGEVGAGAAVLSGADGGRVPEFVRDHRAGQPVDPDQRHRFDRAACGVDRGLPG